jgi:hypothetical protein
MQLIRDHIKEFGILKVVGADAVENMCNDGWCLLAVLSTSAIREANVNVPIPSININGSYASGSVDNNSYAVQPVTVNVPMFLFGKDEHSVTAKLRAEINAKNKHINEMQAAIKNYEDTNNERSKEIDDCKSKVETLQEDKINCQQLLDSKSKMINKIEKDISKVRDYVGSKKFNEIIAGIENE